MPPKAKRGRKAPGQDAAAAPESQAADAVASPSCQPGSSGQSGPRWAALGTPPAELRLSLTLPTGQSFRWRPSGPGALTYTGVVGRRVYSLTQTAGDVLWRAHRTGIPDSGIPDSGITDSGITDSGVRDSEDEAALRDYLHLASSHPPLAALYARFADADARFAAVAPHLPGARVLRQPPYECLLTFICTANNNVGRITGMVESLCAAYGDLLLTPAAAVAAGVPPEAASSPFYAFPSPTQLGKATEAELRTLGFGYRAPYVIRSAALLAQWEAAAGGDKGGEGWLETLRGGGGLSDVEALARLTALPGVGPKVAACAALFSLDRAGLVPVDTHIAQAAAAYYPAVEGDGGAGGGDGAAAVAAAPTEQTPPPKKKRKAGGEPVSLTPRLMARVQSALVGRFGPYAGWAQQVLFVSELRKGELPEALRTPPKRAGARAARVAKPGGEGGGSG